MLRRTVANDRWLSSAPQKPFVRLPSIPRTSARPTEDPTERTTDLIAASVTVWRLDARGAAWSGASGSDHRSDRSAGRLIALIVVAKAGNRPAGPPGFLLVITALRLVLGILRIAVRFCSISKADSRSTVWSYWPATGLSASACAVPAA